MFVDDAAVCVSSGFSSVGCVVPTYFSCSMLLFSDQQNLLFLLPRLHWKVPLWWLRGVSSCCQIWIIKKIPGWHLMKGSPDYQRHFYPSFFNFKGVLWAVKGKLASDLHKFLTVWMACSSEKMQHRLNSIRLFLHLKKKWILSLYKETKLCWIDFGNKWAVVLLRLVTQQVFFKSKDFTRCCLVSAFWLKSPVVVFHLEENLQPLNGTAAHLWFGWKQTSKCVLWFKSLLRESLL